MTCDTLEIRWFFNTAPDAALVDLLEEAAGQRMELDPARTDLYLLFPNHANLGIKLREGLIEHKWLVHRMLGLKVIPQALVLGAWRKIGLPLDSSLKPSDLSSSDWLPVNKSLGTLRWHWNEGRAEVESRNEKVETRCDCELSQVTVKDQIFHSLCFEAEGPDRESLIKEVLLRHFNLGIGRYVNEANRTDYPKWLTRFMPKKEL